MNRFRVVRALLVLVLALTSAPADSADVVVIHQGDFAAAKSLGCPDARFSISGDALRDAKQISVFVGIKLSEQELAEMANAIETTVYPRYLQGICDYREYTEFLFATLGLEITDEQLDFVEAQVENWPQENQGQDNLEEPETPPDGLQAKAATVTDTAYTLIGTTLPVLVFVNQSGTPAWLGFEKSNAINQMFRAGDWMEANAPSQANVSVSAITTFGDTPWVSPSPLGCGDDYDCQCNQWMNSAVTQLGFSSIKDMNNHFLNQPLHPGVPSSTPDNVVPLFMVRNLLFFGQKSSYSCSKTGVPRIALNYFALCTGFWVCWAHDQDVYIHETLHAFGAADEYSGSTVSYCSDPADCTTNVTNVSPGSSWNSLYPYNPDGSWGYPNGNCDLCSGTSNSIMKCCGSGTSGWISSYTRGQIGWGDHDNDLFLDPLDACGTTYGTWCHGCTEPSCTPPCGSSFCPAALSQPSCAIAAGSPCNMAYQCSSGAGNNRYAVGGNFLCQGFCDSAGNCDTAGNCTNCNSLDGCDAGTFLDFSCQPGECQSVELITDLDLDGYDTECEGDCDDGNPDVHPQADEVTCDGIDQDCDGVDICAADLQCDKTFEGNPWSRSTVTYTLTLTNYGTATQQDNPGPELEDVLPGQLLLVSAWADSGVVSVELATNTVSWNGTIPPLSAVTITIEAVVGHVSDGELITNQAASWSDSDGDGTNETGGVSDDPGTLEPFDGTVIAALSIPDIPALTALGLLILAVLISTAGFIFIKSR